MQRVDYVNMNDQLSGQVIKAALEVHSALGPGLLESAYQYCLHHDLEQMGLEVKKEVHLPVQYKDIVLPKAYSIDLLVNNELVVEVKHVDTIIDLHKAQVLTYLKFGGYGRGLILNFNVKSLKDGGIKRVVYGHQT